jgi:cell wall-associated NlpC family hydrolase
MSLSRSKVANSLFALAFALLFSACSSHPPQEQKALPYSANIALYKAPTVEQQAPRSSGLQALSVAREMIGTPYRYGGTDPSGFDCSGLVQYSFSKAGINLPRTSRDIFRSSQLVSPSERQPGDLVFFAISKGKVSHVGIYTGGDQFIHSPSSGKGVSYSSLNNPYWKTRLVGVGRII